mgnify:FL=1|jgi:hypothetical protein
MKDYEQLYYDSQYEIKKLKQRIQKLENDLMLVKKSDKKKLDIKKEILKEFKNYKSKEVSKSEKV